MAEKVTVRTPPAASKKSVQYDLFTQFVSNDVADMSNAVEIWDSIPKYFMTRAQTEKRRTEHGHADPVKWHYSYNNQEFTVTIQPALIEQADGSYKAFFPGVTEELVEEALKKILSDQTYGLHDVEKAETWVRFTLQMIRKELKARARTRSMTEIKHAIEVMSSCVVTVSKARKELWRGAILQDLVTVGREEYLADADAHHIGRLPLFISHSINQLHIRQFNLDRLMACNEQLARWIYRKLIHRFKHASLLTSYHFSYQSVLAQSALLQQARDNDNRRKIRDALEELKGRGALMSYTETLKKEGRKVVDAVYEVRPTGEFISEQKAANKRDSDGQRRAVAAGLRIVPSGDNLG